ncbi:hypothetical protein ACFQI7_15610 [Paenibacillus allorhizosphaerae]
MMHLKELIKCSSCRSKLLLFPKTSQIKCTICKTSWTGTAVMGICILRSR